MTRLVSVKDFIQPVAEAISRILEIDTLVMDESCEAIAGTYECGNTNHNNIISNVLRSGHPEITLNPGESEACKKCPDKGNCPEKAHMHIPIMYRGKAIGVMGIIALKDEQRLFIIEKHVHIKTVIDSMCRLIGLMLNEKDTNARLEVSKDILKKTINSMSDGYVILDENNIVTYSNTQGASVLGYKNENMILNKPISEVAPEVLISLIEAESMNSYDEIEIHGRKTGVIVSPLSNNKTHGHSINFRTLDKLGANIYNKMFNNSTTTFDNLIGKSEKFSKVKEFALLISKSDSSVLLQGESGTGKELFSRAIHNASSRRGGPFVAVNCAAIPPDLLESELFGYESGAFTGASKSGKPGKFEMANAGTIFLDEIGDMPIHLQSKILRVLQERVCERIGSTKSLQLDLRIIAATHKNLEKMITEKLFREDLYYRLSVIPIVIPPLRERTGDIPLMVEYYLKKYCKMFNRGDLILPENVMRLLENYSWHGNVRELDNVMQYIVSVSFNSKDMVICEEFLPPSVLRGKVLKQIETDESSGIVPIKDLEKKELMKALTLFGMSTEGKSNAAKALGISVPTLYRKLASYNLQ